MNATLVSPPTANRTRACRICGEAFSYPISRGTDRWVCFSPDCRDADVAWTLRLYLAAKLARAQPCSASGCAKLATRPDGLCEACYCRRRNHALGKHRPFRPAKPSYIQTGGYIKRYAPDHPLVRRLGRPRHRYEYEHRIVYYDAHGAGPFACHWCGGVVTWDTMHVDHVNDVRTDNRVENLVAAHPVCNSRRGQHKARQAMRARGRRLRLGDTEMCVSEWARRLGISHRSLFARLKGGWSIERALTTPRGQFGPVSRSRPRQLVLWPTP